MLESIFPSFHAIRFPSEDETLKPDFQLSAASHSHRDKHLLIPTFPFAPLNPTPLRVLNAACQDFQVFVPQNLQSVSISDGIQTHYTSLPYMAFWFGRKPASFCHLAKKLIQPPYIKKK